MYAVQPREPLTHSLGKTFNRNSGPRRLMNSKVGGVAEGGFHSGILVIMIAIGLMATSASKPLTIPRQLASTPPRPSGRAKDA